MVDRTEDSDTGETRRARIIERATLNNVPLLTILVTVAVVVGTYFMGKLLYRLRDVLLLMVVGSFVAMILNPLVTHMQRWGLKRRGFAVAVVGAVSLVAFAGLAVLFGYPLVRSLTNLSHALPNYVHTAEHGKGWLGHLLRKYHVEKWIAKNSSKLVSLAQGLSKPALALGKGAFSVLLALVTMFAFVLLLLLEAPRMRVWILENVSSEHAQRLTRIGGQIGRSSSGYMLGNFLTSLIAGIVVFVTLTIVGVPFALLWALWVALVDFLPTIGGALAGIPTVLFALTHSLTAGIVTAVVFLVYTQLENHVLNPIVMSRTVRVNPLTVFMSILIGAEVGSWVGGLFGGFVGVLLAVPGAATVQVMLKEVWGDTSRARREAPRSQSAAE